MTQQHSDSSPGRLVKTHSLPRTSGGRASQQGRASQPGRPSQSIPVKEILRPQFDHRKQAWKIVKKSHVGSGGWRSYGSGAIYTTKQEAQRMINHLCESQPDIYENDIT